MKMHNISTIKMIIDLYFRLGYHQWFPSIIHIMWYIFYIMLIQLTCLSLHCCFCNVTLHRTGELLHIPGKMILHNLLYVIKKYLSYQGGNPGGWSSYRNPFFMQHNLRLHHNMMVPIPHILKRCCGWRSGKM